jgi:hypothetical protein
VVQFEIVAQYQTKTSFEKSFGLVVVQEQEWAVSKVR